MPDTYDYREHMQQDVRNYIESEGLLNSSYTREKLEEHLYETLWCADSVTGNASGSYTCNSYLAEEYLCHNFDLLREALSEFGEEDVNILEKGPEWCDVTIRCYLLSQMISEVLDLYF